MAKQTFSRINVKAAAITGAAVGFLCWLLVAPFSLYGYGMMGYFGVYGMMGYNQYSGYMQNGYITGGVFHNATFGYMLNGTFHPYNFASYYPMNAFHSYSLYSVIIDIILGTLAFLVVAVIYNWALKV